jgi:hypothetical protein
MKIYVYLRLYLAQFFLERGIFGKCRLWDNVEKYFTAVQAIDDHKVQAHNLIHT